MNIYCMARPTTVLDTKEQEFWRLIAEAAFSNPFSEQRLELDLKIAGDFQGESERVARLKKAICDRADRLEAKGVAHLRRYSGNEREVMRIGFLFETFHRFCEQFDQLIVDQTRAGDSSYRVQFASEALGLLARRGFAAEEALRCFGIFYQLRRAYYFIMHGLIGQSPCMRELRRHSWNNVFTQDIRNYDRYLWNRMEDFSTLLLGETGTGKGTAAAAIGRSGFIPFDDRRGCFAESFTRSFVALNLSQHPDALIESELFGHKKGAFTGAIEAHEGIFSRCSPHGAIFLDEIGEVTPPVQIKLLQVLQERTFSPVCSHEKVRFRGRVIAATNRPLDHLREKSLRDDFYYRLCSDIITVPPLRQRLQETPEEMNLLLDHLVSRTAGQPAPELLDIVRRTLAETLEKAYAWPGNVRELEQAVRRILITRSYQGHQNVSEKDLHHQLTSGIENGGLDADALLSSYCTLLYQKHGTYEEVSRRTRLDRRTVKKYLEKGTGERG